MSFIVTGRDIPVNCFRCPLDKGVWKQEQDPFILCSYTKEIVRYDDVPTDRRLPCCGLKEMPDKHGTDFSEAFAVIAEAYRADPDNEILRDYMLKNACCMDLNEGS